MRPPTGENGATATVIARVLPEYRRRGLGTRLHEHALVQARGLDAQAQRPDGIPPHCPGPISNSSRCGGWKRTSTTVASCSSTGTGETRKRLRAGRAPGEAGRRPLRRLTQVSSGG
ncbi:GNAT family N-acetyltransferase [Streptomyces sp. NPDC088394]|uniref:GNAT family N-acetyltransferase n=1 Tax=Streptomyces sp. NPDC088394 TaxID=3365860 RepID=UPI00382929D7